MERERERVLTDEGTADSDSAFVLKVKIIFWKRAQLMVSVCGGVRLLLSDVLVCMMCHTYTSVEEVREIFLKVCFYNKPQMVSEEAD